MTVSICAGKVDINPSWDIEMACGPTRQRVSTIGLGLEANVVIITIRNEKCILISLDTLYIGDLLRQLIETEFAELVPKNRIFLAASHTHYGPQLDPNKPKFGAVDPIHFEAVKNSIINLIKELLSQDSQPAEIFYNKFETSSTISRRLPRFIGGENGRIKFRKVFMGPNQKVTPSVVGNILQIKSKNKTLAYIWQMPCHPTSLPKDSGHHSHFPGLIRKKIRQLENFEVPVVYMQGFSGDLRPNSMANPTGLIEWLRRIILGPWFSVFTDLSFQKWAESIWSEFSTCLTDIQNEKNKLSISAVHVCRSVYQLSNLIKTTNNRNGTMSIHSIRLGNLIIVGISAEVVSDYVKLLRLQIPNMDFIPVGCIDDVFGYAPSSKILNLGGYESEGSRPFFEIEHYRDDFVDKFERGITENIENVLRVE